MKLQGEELEEFKQKTIMQATMMETMVAKATAAL